MTLKQATPIAKRFHQLDDESFELEPTKASITIEMTEKLGGRVASEFNVSYDDVAEAVAIYDEAKS